MPINGHPSFTTSGITSGLQISLLAKRSAPNGKTRPVRDGENCLRIFHSSENIYRSARDLESFSCAAEWRYRSARVTAAACRFTGSVIRGFFNWAVGDSGAIWVDGRRFSSAPASQRRWQPLWPGWHQPHISVSKRSHEPTPEVFQGT
jgi:hypothetical protein